MNKLDALKKLSNGNEELFNIGLRLIAEGEKKKIIPINDMSGSLVANELFLSVSSESGSPVSVEQSEILGLMGYLPFGKEEGLTFIKEATRIFKREE